VSVVGSETGMDARRVDADSSGAMDGTARLSERPLRGVELRLGKDALRSSAAGDAPELLYGIDVSLRHGNSGAYFGLPDDV